MEGLLEEIGGVEEALYDIDAFIQNYNALIAAHRAALLRIADLEPESTYDDAYAEGVRQGQIEGLAGIMDMVRRTREAQKNYFKTRDRDSLIEAKRLESEWDRKIQAYDIAQSESG